MTTDHDLSTFASHFRRRLWQELAEVHDQRNRSNGTSGPDQPDAAPPVRPPSRRPGRRSILVGAGTIAAATLVAAGLVAATQGDGSDPRETDATETELVADIVAKTEAAIDDSVVHLVYEGSADRESGDTWMDQTTLSEHYKRAVDGVPQQEGGWPVAPPSAGDETQTGRDLFHCHRTYRDYTMPVSKRLPDDVSSINERLADGGLAEDGTEVVDGRELLRLRYAESVRSGTLTGTDDYMLIDPVTHLVVRDVINEPNVSSDVTYEYLPRTPENVALASAPAIPEGYTEVDGSEPLADCLP